MVLDGLILLVSKYSLYGEFYDEHSPLQIGGACFLEVWAVIMRLQVTSHKVNCKKEHNEKEVITLL